MNYEIKEVPPDDALYHHGILGQKWGVRNYQYKDGSLTEAGRKRYGSLKENLSKWRIRVKNKSEKIKNQFKEKVEELSEKRKQHLIEKGSPKEIQRNIRKFSPDELAAIEKRFSTELKIHDDVDKLLKARGDVDVERVSSTDQVRNATKFISETSGNLKSASENAAKFYNNIAYAYNAFKPTTSQEMRIIPMSNSAAPRPSP